MTRPAATLDVGGSSELVVELREGTFTVQSLNHTKANVPYSFARPLNPSTSSPLSVHLGDMSIRLRAAPTTTSATKSSSSAAKTSGGEGALLRASSWSTFDSTYLGDAVVVPSTSPSVLAAHDITAIIKASANPNDSFKFPLRVVRSYERTHDGAGLVMRFNLTNAGGVAVEIGGLGFAMPEAPGNPPKGIETTVWNDPHVGGDHGYVEFVRVVDDEKTLLVVPVADGDSHSVARAITSTATSISTNATTNTIPTTTTSGSKTKTTTVTTTTKTTTTTAPLEAWRPILEDLGGSPTWEWCVHSKAWAEDWAMSAQYVCLLIVQLCFSPRPVLATAAATGASELPTVCQCSRH